MKKLSNAIYGLTLILLSITMSPNILQAVPEGCFPGEYFDGIDCVPCTPDCAMLCDVSVRVFELRQYGAVAEHRSSQTHWLTSWGPTRGN